MIADAAIAPSVITAIATIFGVAIGSAFTMWGSYLAATRQANTQMDARREEALERRTQARRDFQRETLIALQDAIADLVRAAGQIQFADVVHHRTTGEPWGRQLVGDEVSNRLHAANVEALKLSARVDDDDLRERLALLRTVVLSASAATSEGEAESRLLNANHLYGEVVERIGEIFRSLP